MNTYYIVGGIEMDILPDDIIHVLLEMVSPSTYYSLLCTTKRFHSVLRKVDVTDIIMDALSCYDSKVLD